MVRDNITWMLVLAEQMLGDRAQAEDAVQEAFLDAFRGLKDFQNKSSLKTWLRRITINSALMNICQYLINMIVGSKPPGLI